MSKQGTARKWRVALYSHDTMGLGLANALAGLEALMALHDPRAVLAGFG